MTDKAAFIGIVRQHEALIYKVARLYTNSREDEQDLYQEIVYQLWKSFDSFRNEAKISTWMYRIALNTSIAYLHKEKRKGSHIPIPEEMLHGTDTGDTLQEERAAALYAVITTLSPIEKAIILLYLEGKTYEEIAGITGFTITNVGTRLGRIRQKIILNIKK